MNRTELNNANKAKFFAQYYFQEVYYSPVFKGFYKNTGRCGDLGEYLLLTPLSLITEEDAIECYDLMFKTNHSNDDYIKGMKGWAHTINKELGGYLPKNYAPIIDFLRSKGYACQWMGLSVDQLVEAGWVQLKTN